MSILVRIQHISSWLFWALLTSALSVGLAGCGGGEADESMLAQRSHVTVVAVAPGVTPFIAFVELEGVGLDSAETVQYTVQGKPDSASKAVSVTYPIDYLMQRGYATPRSTSVHLPVFGLYAGYRNSVAIEIVFSDGSSRAVSTQVATAAYVDPHRIYDRPHILQARRPGTALGYDFFYVKSQLGTPVVVDTDGELRWVGTGVPNAFSSIFVGGRCLVGAADSLQLYRVELDGRVDTSATLLSASATDFNHNLDPGKAGVLGDVDATSSGQSNIDSTLVEFASSGRVIAQWDFAALIAQYMSRAGDQPTLFVRPGVDWFHLNSATYDARDDTIIASS